VTASRTPPEAVRGSRRAVPAGSREHRGRAGRIQRAASTAVLTALEPAARALADDAARHAAALLEAASTAAAEELAAARTEADSVLEQARAEGRSLGHRRAAAELAAARRQARQIVLGAKGRAYEALRAEVLAELTRRAGTDALDALAGRIREQAASLVGAAAMVGAEGVGAPRPEGPEPFGTIAEMGSRRVVASPARLVDHVLRSAGPSLEQLWS
jgi:vacuolar-type H+-ATPase subunit E/Vma4